MVVGSATEEQVSRGARRGAFMSNKQISEAAARGRKVTFAFLSSQPAHEVIGYVVGMDDYHWMVASVVPEPAPEQDPIAIVLVHKSADMISLSSRNSFDQETQEVQKALTDIGGAFWDYCTRNR
jgi:hypothetical protein